MYDVILSCIEDVSFLISLESMDFFRRLIGGLFRNPQASNPQASNSEFSNPQASNSAAHPPVLITLDWLQSQCAKSATEVMTTLLNRDEIRGAVVGMVQTQDGNGVEITMVFCSAGKNTMIHTFTVPWNETSVLQHLDTAAVTFIRPELIKGTDGKPLFPKVDVMLGTFTKTRRVPGQLVGYHPTLDLTTARFITHPYFRSGDHFLSGPCFSCDFCHARPELPPSEFVSYDVREGVDFHVKLTYGTMDGPRIMLDVHVRSFNARDYTRFDNVIVVGSPGRDLWGMFSSLLALNQDVPLQADPNTENLPFCLWTRERQLKAKTPEGKADAEARRKAETERIMRACLEKVNCGFKKI